MPVLGQILLDRSWITDSQLETARRRQKQVGGRLGTAFLEIGAITEELLLKVLAEQLGVPAADIGDLVEVGPDIASLLPAKLAVRAEAVPFRLVGGRVDVAMLDVRNLALQDELSFVIGRRLRIHIANEARIHEALQRYYGKECSLRYLSLLDRLNRRRDSVDVSLPAEWAEPASPERPSGLLFADDRRAEPEGPPRPPPPLEEPPQRTSIPLSREELAELALEGPAESLPGPAPGEVAAEGPAAEPRPPVKVADVLRRFEVDVAAAESPRQVGKLLLEELARHFRLALLFRVRQRILSGWMAWGSRVDARRLARYRASLDDRSQPSVFQELDACGQPREGRLTPLALHEELRAIWGGDPQVVCLLCPLQIRDRTVAAVYVDQGGGSFAPSDAGLVQQLASRAALALERCIVERKVGRAAAVPNAGQN